MIGATWGARDPHLWGWEDNRVVEFLCRNCSCYSMNIVTCIVDFADGQSEIHHLGNQEPRCIDVSLLRASETNTCCVSWTGSWIQARYFCWFHLRYDDPQSLDGQECPWKFSSASLHPSHCPTVACGHCFASRKWKVAEDRGNSWDGGNDIRVAF